MSSTNFHLSDKTKNPILIHEGPTSLWIEFRESRWGSSIGLFVETDPKGLGHTLTDIKEAIVAYEGKLAIRKALEAKEPVKS